MKIDDVFSCPIYMIQQKLILPMFRLDALIILRARMRLNIKIINFYIATRRLSAYNEEAMSCMS